MNLFGKKKVNPVFKLILEGNTNELANGEAVIRGDKNEIMAMVAAVLVDNNDILDVMIGACTKAIGYKLSIKAPKAKKVRAKKN